MFNEDAADIADSASEDSPETITVKPRRDFEPVEPYTMDDITPGGLADRAIKALQQTAPPRDYNSGPFWRRR